MPDPYNYDPPAPAAPIVQDDIFPAASDGATTVNLPGAFVPTAAEVVTHTPVNLPAPGVHLTAPESVDIDALHVNALFSPAVDNGLKNILAGLLLGHNDPETAKQNLAAYINDFVARAETAAVSHLPLFTRAIVGQVLSATDAQEKTLAAKLAGEIVDALTK